MTAASTRVDTVLGALDVRVHGSGPPTLVVTSPDDPLWTPAQAQATAAGMPHAEHAVVPGGAHLTPFETPGETISLVMRLWAGE